MEVQITFAVTWLELNKKSGRSYKNLLQVMTQYSSPDHVATCMFCCGKERSGKVCNCQRQKCCGIIHYIVFTQTTMEKIKVEGLGLKQFNSIQFYLYSAKLQQLSSQGT